MLTFFSLAGEQTPCMRRVRDLEPIPLDTEIERTLKSLKKQAKVREISAKEAEMDEQNQLQVADTRALREYALPQVTGVPTTIRKPTI